MIRGRWRTLSLSALGAAMATVAYTVSSSSSSSSAEIPNQMHIKPASFLTYSTQTPSSPYPSCEFPFLRPSSSPFSSSENNPLPKSDLVSNRNSDLLFLPIQPPTSPHHMFWSPPPISSQKNAAAADGNFCSGQSPPIQSVANNKKPVTAVVLLGWLGAKQKHLKLYADWYNARGIHAVTFVLPMSDVLSLKHGGRAEQHVEFLASQLRLWLEEGVEIREERLLIFHTFSNTGWLIYGVVLEKLLREQDHKLVGKIKGCVVDSAPVAELNPQVWASGFSAALLKKSSIATRGATEQENCDALHANNGQQIQPQPTETALLVMLEKFFTFFLGLPPVKRRLSEVISILSKQQPECPQLYLYSAADRVIPAESVELFIEQQRRAGREVRSYNLQRSPHVDHFRTYPDVYATQLASFLNECIPPSSH